jgi:hypothetical protein
MKAFNHYLAVMNAGAVQAGVHSLKAYVSVAVAHATTDAIPALSFQQMIAVFGVAFLLSVLDYMDKNPLPIDETPVENKVAIPQIQPAPSQPESPITPKPVDNLPK